MSGRTLAFRQLMAGEILGMPGAGDSWVQPGKGSVGPVLSDRPCLPRRRIYRRPFVRPEPGRCHPQSKEGVAATLSLVQGKLEAPGSLQFPL